jgi:flagellar basal-body rod protein FlgF
LDRLIYTAMTGAKMLTQRQETISHNLANVSTPGFRAELTAFRAVPVVGPGSPSRVASVETTTGADFATGPMTHTGNPLDVAVNGRGFFVVQGPDGADAYTRDGGFMVNAEGNLVTRTGLAVQGEGGPIAIPQGAEVTIARDGTLTALQRGQGNAVPIQLGRLRLVNPDDADLERGGDGLFRMKAGGDAPADPNVVLAPNTIEGSNVNAVEALVGMIAVARQFETQMRLVQNAEQNARSANQLLSLG